MSTSKWPKRLALTGSLVLGLSIAIMWSMQADVTAITDPGGNHLLSLDEGDSAEVNLSKNTSYIIFRLVNEDANCTITEVATETEVTIGSPSFLQMDRPGIEGDLYYIVGVFIPDGDGLHLVENTASDNNSSLWIIDEYDLSSDEMKTLNIASGATVGLCFGVCLLPISLFLWLSGRKKGARAGLVMQTADGMMIPIAPASGTAQQRVPTTDEVWRSVHGGEVLDLTVQQVQPIDPEAPAPFADRPDRVGELTRVVDEIETVDDSVPTEGALREELGLTKDAEDGTENAERTWKTWDEG